MTVISGMKFNDWAGAIVADEQVSYGLRKSGLATKLTPLTSNDNSICAVLGGTGAADVLYDAAKEISHAVKNMDPNKPLTDAQGMADLVSYFLGRVKQKYIDGYLFAKFRLREIDFQSGNLTTPEGLKPMDPALKEHYQQLISGQVEAAQFLNNSFLLLAGDKNGIQLYNTSMFMANPVPVSKPYEIVGLGDTADNELNAFFENMPREERANIDQVKGIAALLNATDRASVRNQGVGGTPLIGIIKDSKFLMPGENNSKLSVELVKAERHGFLSPQFVYSALEQLIFGNGQFEAVEKEMWQEASKLGQQEKLDRLLRGYKMPIVRNVN
ncbi:MAG: hypothetical protein V1702_03670 [Candidatus Woesearchaeota archaeon]